MRDSDRERVAANIRAELARKGKNQSDLARELGMTRQSMSQRLLGRVRISGEEVARIAEYLGISADVLLASGDREAVAA